jgi:hypothetical protein
MLYLGAQMRNFLFLSALVFLSTTAFSFEGDDEREQVKAAISAHSNETHVCYRDNQKAIRGATGKIFFEFEVDDKGGLVRAELNKKKTTLNNDVLIKCMQEKFKTWSYPAAPKGTTIKVIKPFAFTKLVL